MFIRYNSSIKFWEYDTSVGQNGVGPWLILPVDPSNMLGGGSVSPHHLTHEPGGSDPLNVDAIPATGSLRTLGPGAQQAAPGNDARFTNSRPPTAHHATHETGGADAIIGAAWLAQSNVFTGVRQEINGASPSLQIFDTTQPVNARRFQIINQGGNLYFQATDDAVSASQGYIYINRAGSLGGALNLNANGYVNSSAGFYERGRNTLMGEWIGYTPTTSASGPVVSNIAFTAQYMLIGKTMFFQFQSNPFSIDQAGGGAIYVSMPFAPSGGYPLGFGSNVVNFYNGSAWTTVLGYLAGGDARYICYSSNYGVSPTNYLWGTAIVPISGA